MENRGLWQIVTGGLMYLLSGISWVVQETSAFFSWTAVVFATILGGHGILLLIVNYAKKGGKDGRE